ncbi:MAG: asparagine synthase (glutamine-hydrolyzing) [Bacteroidetes bacterium]|nr:asparagine synthase (glutamine-hydrolyzing) [Bacteroidota bacterium]
MCGFAGVFEYHRSARGIDDALLARMGEAIVHRGPDDGGLYRSDCGRIGFSFRRLSIIDLSAAGHQPMSTPDGRIWLVFNGEIYNHLALRAELERAGYSYRSRSDTETILYAYRHWGERFIERLHGMFAIAIWDVEKEQLFLYRDRIGIKPLYYAEREGTWIFGSEIKALLEHPALRPAVDREALHHYFTYIHTPAPWTMFEGVRKLEAGHFARIGRDGVIDIEEYWDALGHREADFDYHDEEAVTGRVRDLFRSAVEKRMMSDVPFGVFLSGGIDSSANVAFMSELMDRPVDTFTVAIRGQEDTNEFQWARRMAAHFHTNHHEVMIDDSGFLDLLPTIVHHQDEPLADPVCFPLYHVSKLARDNGTIVVQVGEGSDEQFAGYAAYLRAVRMMRLERVLRPVPRALTSGAYALLRPLLAHRQVDYRQNVIRNVLEKQPAFWGNAIGFYDAEKARALNAATFAGLDLPSSYTLAQRRFERAVEEGYGDDLQRIVYWEIKHRLAELLLMRVDKITMATSIEARVPFLDHLMLEFTMNIPSAMKMKGGNPKHVLKQALRGILPDDIIDRKKIGFAGSGKNMMTTDIFQHARSLLLSPRHDYYNLPYIRSLLDEYERTKINYTPQLWTLYNFELWHRWWIEGDRSLS